MKAVDPVANANICIGPAIIATSDIASGMPGAASRKNSEGM